MVISKSYKMGSAAVSCNDKRGPPVTHVGYSYSFVQSNRDKLTTLTKKKRTLNSRVEKIEMSDAYEKSLDAEAKFPLNTCYQVK
jgi:hypothetical protein